MKPTSLPMARNLAVAGYAVHAFDIDARALTGLAAVTMDLMWPR